MLWDVLVLCWGLEAVVGVSSTPHHGIQLPTLTRPTLSQALTIFCGYFCLHHSKKMSERLVSPDPATVRTLQYSTISSISPPTTSSQWPKFSHYVMCPVPC